MTRAIWKLSKSEQIVALVAVLTSLVARGLAILPGYAIDDYLFINDQRQSLGLTLAQGRPGAVLLQEFLLRLDAMPPNSGMVGSVLLSLMLVWVGILVCRLWRIDHLPWLSGLVVLFICLHPYQAEVFTFRVAVFTLAVALALAFTGIAICHFSRRAQAAGVLLIAASLLTYQAILNYLAMAVLFCMVFTLATLFGLGEQIKVDRVELACTLRRQVVTVVLAAAGAALVMLAIPRLFGVPLVERTTLIHASEARARVFLAVRQLGVMFALGEPIMPAAAKWLLALTPVAALALATLRSPTGALRQLFSRRSLPFILAITAGVPASLGVVLFLQEWWPVPRVCTQISIFWAGAFALVYLAVPVLSRRLMLAASALILLSFIGSNNHIFQDQMRVNLRDMAKANRIVSRLEALPGFSPTEGVAVVGGQWGYTSPLKTVQGDMNISALFAEWSKIYLLNEVSGYNFQPVPPDARGKAQEYCLTAPKWPASEAVARIDSFGVVCQ